MTALFPSPVARVALAVATAARPPRWPCGKTDGGVEARQAFTTLHRLFPNSEWAAKTKDWYR